MQPAAALLSSITVMATGGLAVTATSFAALGDEPASIATQAGVFGIAIAIAYWLLKRSDTREDKVEATAQVQIAALQVSLQSERERYDNLLSKERERHDETRHLLAEAMTKIALLESRLEALSK